MKQYKITNRYNDEFTFTPQEDGTILWEGKFEYTRLGWPNDYTKAFFEYTRDTGGGISLEQFKELVHAYDDEKESYVLEDRKYSELVTSNTAVINMVDPSGGPYLMEDMAVESISEEITGLVIDRFESVETGWKIFLKNA
jgi:c-di-AMP phosphodiesterase-like protein